CPTRCRQGTFHWSSARASRVFGAGGGPVHSLSPSVSAWGASRGCAVISRRGWLNERRRDDHASGDDKGPVHRVCGFTPLPESLCQGHGRPVPVPSALAVLRLLHRSNPAVDARGV